MKAVLLVALAAAIGVLAFAGATQAPGPGPGWTDASPEGHEALVQELARAHEVRVLQHSLGALPTEAGAGDALVLFPTHRPASDLERARVWSFVDAGGLLVVATDGGNGRPWLDDLGLALQEVPALLPPGAPAGCVATPAPLVDGGSMPICLPSPTVFPDLARLREALAAAGAEGAAAAGEAQNSTQAVILDLDGDGTLSLGDQGPLAFPMAVHVRRGAGDVVVLSDADLWRNAAASPNLAYAAALTGEAGVVYLDSSSDHGAAVDAWRRPAYQALSAPTPLQAAGLGLAGASLLLISLRLPRAPRWDPHRAPRLEEDEALEERIAAATAASRHRNQRHDHDSKRRPDQGSA